MGLKNVENSAYINTVIQLLSSIVPLSNFFLTPSLSSDAISNSSYTCIHISNIINQLWHGSEAYQTAWDLIQLFQLHYVQTAIQEHPVVILKFLLQKMKIELSRDHHKNEVLTCIPKDFIYSQFAVHLPEHNERKTVIEELLSCTQEHRILRADGEERIIMYKQDYLALDIPLFTAMFESQEAKANNFNGVDSRFAQDT